MDPQRFQQIQDMVAEALELPAERREAFLARACGDDAELRSEVDSLVAASAEADGYFDDLGERALADVSEAHREEDTESAEPFGGGKIGPYRLIEVIGEGGMGVVWMAEQREPVRRKVALKIVRLGMNTREIAARFQTERQALALMDHSGIAKVLDGGITDDGRPYFVMELVQGVPIDRYCDAQKLNTRQRIELILQVCQAVQHAHFKGVVHRDIKPNNILVGIQEQKATAKIIDFGIAKAIGGSLTDQTLVTYQGQFIGTPAFVSPEQADLSGIDVDSRTDVYSLGVLLYVVLVGALPVDLQNVDKRDMRNVIQDTDITRPSARISELGEDTETIARNRQTSPEALRRTLQDELDWIALKAMENDRTRRYETASALADDLQRYLDDEPVVARPPGVSYKLKKFVRRNRLPVVATLGLILLLLSFGIVVSLQAGRVARERDRAVQVSQFLGDLFEGADPYGTSQIRTDTMRVRQFVKMGRQNLAQRLDEQPDARAHLLAILGKVHRNWGDLEEAQQLLTEAKATREELGEGETAEAVLIAEELGLTLTARGDFDGAEALLGPALQARRREGDPEALGKSIQAYGDVFNQRGELQEANDLYREAVEVLESAFGEHDHRTAQALGNYGTITTKLGDLEKAEQLFRKALYVNRTYLDETHPQIATSINNLAYVLEERGKLEEAEKLHEEALAIRRARFQSPHPDIARSINNLAYVRLEQKRYEEARDLYAESLEMRIELYGEHHPAVAVARSNLAATLRRMGDLDGAEPQYRWAAEVLLATLGPDHPRMATMHNNIGDLVHQRGECKEAITHFEEALRIRREVYDADHYLLATVLTNLARCYRNENRIEDARVALAEARQILEPKDDQVKYWNQLMDEYIRLHDQADERALAQEFEALKR